MTMFPQISHSTHFDHQIKTRDKINKPQKKSTFLISPVPSPPSTIPEPPLPSSLRVPRAAVASSRWGPLRCQCITAAKTWSTPKQVRGSTQTDSESLSAGDWDERPNGDETKAQGEPSEFFPPPKGKEALGSGKERDHLRAITNTTQRVVIG